MIKKPVFIIGINPRSGTNYLMNLLTLHPECSVSQHYGEDFILYGSDKYFDFYNKVISKWAVDWNNNPAIFKKCLEQGILNYLDPKDDNARYIVSKTPDPTNSDRFLEMFSEGYLILIIRRGQDVTQSYIKTFENRFNDAVRGWRNGAKWICKILNNPDLMNSGRVICVKYEELYKENEKEMRRILDFLELDHSVYDFETSENYDIIGSSSYKRKSDKVSWEPIPKDSTFKPLSRSSNWSRWKHYRFNCIAGKLSKQLGYDLHYSSKGLLYFSYISVMLVWDFSFRVFRWIRMYLENQLVNREKM